MAGYMLTGGQMRDIRETVRIARQQTGGGKENPRHFGVQADRAVILDAALGTATHALTGATHCLATRCIWSPADEEYTETTEQLTVWNHSEAQEYEADTFGLARWIDGHWYFMGDCAAMDSR